MSKKAAVTIACRALAVYFLFWFFSDLTYLPSDVFALWHREHLLSAIAADTYWRDYYRLSLSFRLLRMVVLFFGVQWFYRSSPAVQGYFLDPTDDEPAAE